MTLFVSVPTRFTGTGCMDGGGPVSLIPQTQGTVYGHVSADPGASFLRVEKPNWALFPAALLLLADSAGVIGPGYCWRGCLAEPPPGG